MTLLEALKKLRADAPNVPRRIRGICGNLLAMGVYEDVDRGISEWLKTQTLAYPVNPDLLQSFPVEVGDYTKYNEQENKWEGEYADRRLALLDFLIEYYKPGE